MVSSMGGLYFLLLYLTHATYLLQYKYQLIAQDLYRR